MDEDQIVDAVARAMWRSREMMFPRSVRRIEPDAIDHANGNLKWMRDMARAAIAAHKAAFAEAGLVIVPREPTGAQHDAAYETHIPLSHNDIEAIYRAMIAATADQR